MDRLFASAALALMCACAALDDPPTAYDRHACVSSLTGERVMSLQRWVGEQMGVSGDVAPPTAIECLPHNDMAALYHLAGSDARRPLGVYVPHLRTVYLNDARSYPGASDHILGHELCHHLQWEHGFAMTLAEREHQCEAVHELWRAQ